MPNSDTTSLLARYASQLIAQIFVLLSVSGLMKQAVGFWGRTNIKRTARLPAFIWLCPFPHHATSYLSTLFLTNADKKGLAINNKSSQLVVSYNILSPFLFLPVSAAFNHAYKKSPRWVRLPIV
ncbi:hypothetical protein B0H63DRAFT_459994 [Podospora didyma]|uniref:Uncharacterized protein n=1 Tax=Podospora didyma TaxID=330526 RepID=A0AAE0P6A2_9PEZI|nr:hypothetical protein B0H63DRAFT_459994 [Podospora didyma]